MDIEERTPPPMANKKLWEMAKVITDKQKAAKEYPSDRIDFNLLEEFWFDWLEEQIFESTTH